MGVQTTLYIESREVIAAFDQDNALDFGAGEALELDKAMPVLGYLISADAEMKNFYYTDYLEIGDAALRSFSPENVQMFLRRLTDNVLVKNLASIDWEAEVAGYIYPFDKKDKKSDCENYIFEYGSRLQDFLTIAVSQENGIMSVEC